SAKDAADRERWLASLIGRATSVTARGVAKLTVISAARAGPRAEQAIFERWIAMSLLETFFGAIYAEIRRMEAILRPSTASWVALRPPRLVDRPVTGTCRIDTKPLHAGLSLTYPELAIAPLAGVRRTDLYGHAA